MITCDRQLLHAALRRVAPAVGGKSTIPVLTTVLITPEILPGDRHGSLRVQATNLEIGITTWVAAQQHGPPEPGIAIPARLVLDIIGNVPNGPVQITVNAKQQEATIKAGGSTNTIKGIDPGEFPPMPAVMDQHILHLDAGLDQMQQALAQTVIAAAKDTSRPVLAGVFLRYQPDQVILAAADGYRLARTCLAYPTSEHESHDLNDLNDLIIPAHAMHVFGQHLATAQSLTMAVQPDGNQIVLATDTTHIVSRLIDGRYPDFARIIPTESQTQVRLGRQDLLDALKLVRVFAAQSRGVMKLEIKPSSEDTQDTQDVTLELSANAVEVGDNTSILIPRACEGVLPNQIALNAAYLTEAITAIATEQVQLDLISAHTPARLRPVTTHGEPDDSYTHIIMPMSLGA
jgi:DNA polymerase-3 subunit beta